MAADSKSCFPAGGPEEYSAEDRALLLRLAHAAIAAALAGRELISPRPASIWRNLAAPSPLCILSTNCAVV